MGNRQAMDVALGMYRHPATVRATQDAPLPEGMLTVIRIAAGAEVDADIISPDRARNAEEAREAAVFFLQQVLFRPQSTSYRLLGLAAGAELAQVREHKRWLLKWLHPDRNPNTWESALFQRVVKAAEDLEQRLDGAAPALATVTAERKRRRRPRRMRLEQFAARRVRKPLNFRSRVLKYLRRFVVSTAILAFGVLVWGSLNGKPLGSVYADGPAAWLHW